MAAKEGDAAKKVKNPLAEAQNWEQRVKTELEVQYYCILCHIFCIFLIKSLCYLVSINMAISVINLFFIFYYFYSSEGTAQMERCLGILFRQRHSAGL